MSANEISFISLVLNGVISLIVTFMLWQFNDVKQGIRDIRNSLIKHLENHITKRGD